MARGLATHTCVLLVVLSCLAVFSSAAPLPRPEANSSLAIGNQLLKWTIDGAFPEDTSKALTAEVGL